MNQKKTSNSRPRKHHKRPQKSQSNQNQPKNPNQNSQPNQQPQNQPKKRKNNVSRPPRVKAVKEYTSGGIVFRIVDGTIEVVLLQDLKARWSLPKGHIESGETARQAAVREVSEETNLQSLKIISQLDKIHFFYRLNGKLIFMTNFLFLIEATNHAEKLATEEDAPWIVDVQWFEAEQAYDIIEYKATKVILREAIDKIKKWYNS